MRRALLLTVKEFRQVGRDPSALLLAFVIPVLMMLLFGFCLNLDAPVTPVALVVQDTGEPALRLRQQVEGSPYFRTRLYRSEAAAVEALRRGKAQAALLIPADCSRALQRGESPRVAALTDGCVPNTAQFAANYLQSLVQAWAAEQVGADAAISLRRSCRYNPAALSRHYLLPSSITMVLSFVATFLTAMVVAREWERGTMEQLLTTPVTRGEFIISKLLPYWVLGMGALSVCILCTRCLFGVPMRAPLWAVAGVGGLFLLSVLSMGLLISTLVRNQYTASLLAMVASILPTMLLSGLIFEISSMPAVIRAISYFIPARYLLRAYTTLFLAGPMWQVLLHQILFLAVSALFWCSLVPLVTPKRLD